MITTITDIAQSVKTSKTKFNKTGSPYPLGRYASPSSLVTSPLNLNKMTLRSTAKHVMGVIAWGGAFILVTEVLVTIGVVMVMGRHRFQLPRAFLNILDGIYSITTFPAAWIQPQTPFDNMLWSYLSVGLFWGVSFHTLAFLIKQQCRKQKKNVQQPDGVYKN